MLWINFEISADLFYIDGGGAAVANYLDPLKGAFGVVQRASPQN